MRGVCDEMTLHVKRHLHPNEQRIQLVHQRPYLAGQPGGGQGRQIMGSALGHLACGALKRCQRTANKPPHGQHQQRCEGGKRQHCPKSQGLGTG